MFPISSRLGFQTGSNMGPQNWPKTDPKPDKSSTNLYEPTRRSQNGSEARKTSKNMQKTSKKVPTWPHHGTPILIQSMPKASPRRPFLGASQYSKMCHNRLHQSHLGCIMGSKDYHMVRSAQQLQQSVREFASQWATTHCIHLLFSTIACVTMVRHLSPCITATWQHTDLAPSEFSYHINCLDAS